MWCAVLTYPSNPSTRPRDQDDFPGLHQALVLAHVDVRIHVVLVRRGEVEDVVHALGLSQHPLHLDRVHESARHEVVRRHAWI